VPIRIQFLDNDDEAGYAAFGVANMALGTNKRVHSHESPPPPFDAPEQIDQRALIRFGRKSAAEPVSGGSAGGRKPTAGSLLLMENDTQAIRAGPRNPPNHS
jgi:hypothetical protein